MLANGGIGLAGSWLASVAMDTALKGVLVLGVAALGSLVLRRRSAAVRHLVWTLGVMGVLGLPLLSGVLPPIPVPMLARTERVVEVPVAADVWTPAVSFDVATTRVSGDAFDAVITVAPPAMPEAFTPVAEAPAPARGRLIATLLLLWSAGSVSVLVLLLVEYARVARYAGTAAVVRDRELQALVARLSSEIGLVRTPVLLEGESYAMPMTWGLFRPVLLLPEGAAEWPAARLRAVLLHELAHVRRRDALTQFAAQVVCALYWFNPLAWLAAKRLYVEREHACDDIVLCAGERASDYAGELLGLVRALRPARATAMAAIAMARPSQLRERLNAVLDDGRSRAEASIAQAFRFAVVGALLLIPLAALQPVQRASGLPVVGWVRTRVALPVPPRPPRPPRAPRALRAPPGTAPAMAPLPAVAPLATLAPMGVMYATTAAMTYAADQEQDECGPKGRNSSISHNSNSDDDIQTVKWSIGRCSGSARIEGKVRFSGDFSGIASLSPGGLFRIEQDDGTTDRRLVVRADNGGKLDFEYRVDGKDRAFDDDGRAWLNKALTFLFRTTGFAADERVDYLLRTRGPQAVLDEVGQMRSDYVQRVYLQRLIERTDLSPTLVRNAVELAGRELDSDYELAELLIAFARKYDFDDATRASFLRASTSIQSDYEHRRVLSTALQKGGLSNQDVTAMLESATAISSDYERAELLVALAGKYQLDAPMRSAYLNAATAIRSDYEQRRVLDNLLKKSPQLAAADVAAILESAQDIRSDYEKAELLIGLTTHDLGEPALQRAYLTAVSGIRSDYEHRRSLMALLQKERLSSSSIDLVLAAAPQIESDYELAELLVYVAQHNDLNERQRDAFMKAMDTIQSQHEYGRLASILLKKR